MAVALLSQPAKNRAAHVPLIWRFTNDVPDLLPFRIWAGYPATHINAADDPMVQVGEIDANVGLDGVIIINVSAFLKARFKSDPTVEGKDLGIYKGYYIQYGNTTYDQVTAVRWGLDASVQPDIPDGQPMWTIVEGTQRCKSTNGNSTGWTGEREAQFVDGNPCSSTYQQQRGGGAYFVFETNLGLCPLYVNTTPDPQFAGNSICRYTVPRETSEVSTQKQDKNVNSPSYLKWLKLDGTYTTVQADGYYFPTGVLDPTGCPTVIDETYNTHLESSGGNYRATIAHTLPVNLLVTVQCYNGEFGPGTNIGTLVLTVTAGTLISGNLSLPVGTTYIKISDVSPTTNGGDDIDFNSGYIHV